MTAARTGLSVEGILANIANGFREGARWILRGILALAIIFMAGVIAVVTAAVGLIIAAIAVMLRLTGASPKVRRTSSAPKPSADGITLDAHRTARGWTVE